ncbi:MAG: cation:proton antiporter [Candidatus Gracilibacteria bacterium]|nr:cation:proton antiporter [Candidatus Gracilibacteria bacterium]
MQELFFLSQTLSFLILLVICSFAYILSKKINFPYTVLLVIIGLLLVPISKISLFGFIDDFKLTPDILFYVFLPILLFEGAYNINYKHLLANWKTISALAIFGLLISGFIISIVLFFIFPFVGLNIPYLVCLLFGVLISSTDPVAVLSIFKSLGAPRRLTVLFEGESLFNDGTSVAIFLVILGLITEGGLITGFTYIEGIWKFLSMLIGGILFGGFTGVLFSKIIGRIKNSEEVEIVLTMLLAHLTFIFAEIITIYFPFIPISGVISTVIASIVIGNYGKYKITPRVEVHMQKFWEFFAFVSNSIVFILMGLILSTIDIKFSQFILPLFITIFTVMIARVISVYIPIFTINIFKLEENIPYNRVKLLSWGSLRGALALMMVLLIPGVGHDDYEKILAFEQLVGWSYDFSIKDFLTVITIGSIMFTLFIKAPLIPKIMRHLKLDKLNKLEEFEYEEGKILTCLKVIDKLNTSYKKSYFTKKEYDKLILKYTEKLNFSINNIKIILGDKEEESISLIRKVLSLHALGIEKQYLKELFFYNEIDEHNFKYILRKIEKQMDRVEHDNYQLRKISNSENDYDIFSQFIFSIYKKTSTNLDAYIRNRTRLIITRKVIKELKKLSEINFGFDVSIFDEVIDLYNTFNLIAEEKRLKLLSEHQTSINAIESNLITKSLLKIDENVVKDLYKKEIITPKLYIKFMNEIEHDMYKDIKEAQKNSHL